MGVLLLSRWVGLSKFRMDPRAVFADLGAPFLGGNHLSVDVQGKPKGTPTAIWVWLKITELGLRRFWPFHLPSCQLGTFIEPQPLVCEFYNSQS